MGGTMSIEKNPESLLPKIAWQRSSLQNKYMRTHTYRVSKGDHVEVLYLKDSGREMEAFP